MSSIQPFTAMFCPVGDVCYMFNKTRPKVVFCDIDLVDLLKECLEEIKLKAEIFTFGGASKQSESVEKLLVGTGTEETFVPPEIGDKSKAISFISCSSGTTGLSKAVCISHAALLNGTYLPVQPCVTINFSSLYWISGVFVMLASAMNGCTRIITTQSFTPERFFEIVRKHKVESTQKSSKCSEVTLFNHFR